MNGTISKGLFYGGEVLWVLAQWYDISLNWWQFYLDAVSNLTFPELSVPRFKEKKVPYFLE